MTADELKEHTDLKSLHANNSVNRTKDDFHIHLTELFSPPFWISLYFTTPSRQRAFLISGSYSGPKCQVVGEVLCSAFVAEQKAATSLTSQEKLLMFPLLLA